jgi:hypothetical protein
LSEGAPADVGFDEQIKLEALRLYRLVRRRRCSAARSPCRWPAKDLAAAVS